MNPDARTLNVRIPPHARFSRAVRQEVIGFAKNLRIGGEDLDEFIFALGEALANAIEHARGSEAIEVRCHLEDDKILATVIDSGAGFKSDPLATVSLPHEFAERGRGLPIMRRCTDIFAVHSVPGRGTAVVLGRYLRQRGRAWNATEETEIAS
jgi:serine/threonine-protein kinase RsbW